MNVSRRTCLLGIVSGVAAALLLGAAEAQVGRMRRGTRRRTRRRTYAVTANHTTTEVGGTTYYVMDGVTYEAVMEEGRTVYVEVVE